MATNQYSFIRDSKREKMLLKFRADWNNTALQRPDFFRKKRKGICKDIEKAATEETRFECQGKPRKTGEYDSVYKRACKCNGGGI